MLLALLESLVLEMNVANLAQANPSIPMDWDLNFGDNSVMHPNDNFDLSSQIHFGKDNNAPPFVIYIATNL
jgi:hypothetical protein